MSYKQFALELKKASEKVYGLDIMLENPYSNSALFSSGLKVFACNKSIDLSVVPCEVEKLGDQYPIGSGHTLDMKVGESLEESLLIIGNHTEYEDDIDSSTTRIVGIKFHDRFTEVFYDWSRGKCTGGDSYVTVSQKAGKVRLNIPNSLVGALLDKDRVSWVVQEELMRYISSRKYDLEEYFRYNKIKFVANIEPQIKLIRH